jgi:Rieske Fe-S protein
MNTDRKEFLKKAGSVALFAALGINLQSCSNSTGSEPEEEENNNSNPIVIEGNTVTLDISSSFFNDLQNQNGMIVSVSGGFLAVNVDGTTIRAFSNVCTHLSCSNNWELPGDRFICTCHNSVFNLSGEPISGPASRDLPEYTVTRSGDTLVITKG